LGTDEQDEDSAGSETHQRHDPELVAANIENNLAVRDIVSRIERGLHVREIAPLRRLDGRMLFHHCCSRLRTPTLR
jgi:hypothetical protein